MRKVYEAGSKIGELTLLRKTGEKVYNGYYVWECKCSCGNTCERSTHYFASKKKRYCCPECSKETQRKAVTTHGLYTKYPRLTAIGREAMYRCNNPKNKSYKNYGGRGIKFEFDSLKHFVEWSLENGYKDGYSIERKDNNGNYNPENCCWIPEEKQASNKRITPEFHGHKGLQAIADYLGITNKALQAMIYKKKMTFEEIYEASKNDPTFHLSLYEKTSIKARRRKDQWRLSKQDVEDILKQLDEGKTKSFLAREVYKVAYKTLEKSIQRYNKGLYD